VFLILIGNILIFCFELVIEYSSRSDDSLEEEYQVSRIDIVDEFIDTAGRITTGFGKWFNDGKKDRRNHLNAKQIDEAQKVLQF
jgi:hypothetical protein